MFNFSDYFLLTEGGAGGHLKHPFELEQVKNGKDLIQLYYAVEQFLNHHSAPLKIDGINASIRLVEVDGKKQFAFYRGAVIDVQNPPTVNKLSERFESKGLVNVATKVLTIFNRSLPFITQQLTDLGMYDDPMVFLNIEYVHGDTNIVNYSNNFLAVHYTARITEQISPIRKTLSYTSKIIPFDSEILESLVKQVNRFAQQYQFNVIHQVEAKLVHKPDFDRALNSMLTIDGDVDSLRGRLLNTINPRDKSIVTTDNNKIAALSQALYIKVIEQKNPLKTLVKPESLQSAVDGLVFWHAARLLGNAILNAIDTPLGFGSHHEGIVINNQFVAPEPFKITGEFFVKNALHSPYKKKQITKVVVIYPGRFQPFHLGHARAFAKLTEKFSNADLYISTSNKVDPPISPFNFQEKVMMIQATGINPQSVRMCESPYTSKEIMLNYDPNTTIVIYAVGMKDMKQPNPRFTFSIKQDGYNSYHQPFTELKYCQAMSRHSYVLPIATESFKMLGVNIDSASAIRNLWQNTSDNQKQTIIEQLYGEFDSTIYNLFNRRLI